MGKLWELEFITIAQTRQLNVTQFDNFYFISDRETFIIFAKQRLFWQIGGLETIVYNLKSIANFGNLNVFCYINEIYWVADIW